MSTKTKTTAEVRPWRSGFCAPGNPAESHARCGDHPRPDGKPCCCECHVVAAAAEVVTPPVATRSSRRWAKGDVVDDRGTHPLVFADLAERFGPFTVDVAAAAHNAKCERFYDREADGLNQSWAGETVWCNPPYSEIAPWVQKAWSEHVDAVRIVMLLPATRTEQQWWQAMVEPFRDRAGSPLEVRFLAGRMRFLRPGQTAIGPGERPPFGCALLVWDRGAGFRHVYDPEVVTGGMFTEAVSSR